ncbi:hypothetical protein GGI00_001346 [Coemansia sp. RSA 2681]|nr:hypothetical protein GGI00_001346 [Coemansia sp. RSA 2681]
MPTTDKLHTNYCMAAASRSGDTLHARPLRGLSRSSSSASRKIAALNNFVSSAGRRGSLLATRESAHTQSRRPSIRRVDVAPAANNTSIQAIDALFEQYQRDELAADSASLASAATALANELKLTICTSSAASDRDSLEDNPPSPAATASTLESSSDTLAQPSLARKGGLAQPPLIDELLDTLFPRLPPDTKPYHAYYNVATVDGEPTIPKYYACPTAMCAERFMRFESLQAHWSAAHPWNRRGVLVPVTAGGIRRLSFWQHKARFALSLLQGPHCAGEFGPGGRPATSRRRSVWSALGGGCSAGGGSVTTSDYGDIRLLGPRSYLVSPRVLPMEQVRIWEAERDCAAFSDCLSI